MQSYPPPFTFVKMLESADAHETLCGNTCSNIIAEAERLIKVICQPRPVPIRGLVETLPLVHRCMRMEPLREPLEKFSNVVDTEWRKCLKEWLRIKRREIKTKGATRELLQQLLSFAKSSEMELAGHWAFISTENIIRFLERVHHNVLLSGADTWCKLVIVLENKFPEHKIFRYLYDVYVSKEAVRGVYAVGGKRSRKAAKSPSSRREIFSSLNEKLVRWKRTKYTPSTEKKQKNFEECVYEAVRAIESKGITSDHCTTLSNAIEAYERYIGRDSPTPESFARLIRAVYRRENIFTKQRRQKLDKIATRRGGFTPQSRNSETFAAVDGPARDILHSLINSPKVTVETIETSTRFVLSLHFCASLSSRITTLFSKILKALQNSVELRKCEAARFMSSALKSQIVRLGGFSYELIQVSGLIEQSL